MKDLATYLEEVIENIRSDREITKELLNDVVSYLSKNEENHREVGSVAAKYVETLQRSNEQLVKVSALMQKREQQSQDFSLDHDQIFDLLDKSTAPEEE
jgi:predicted secreted Zn-dependent protease